MRGALLLLLFGLACLAPTVGRFSSLLDEGCVTSPADRLVLSIDFAEAERTGYPRFDRPHAHTYTILAVSATAGCAIK